MNRVRKSSAGKVALVSGAALLAVALPSAVFALGGTADGITLSSENRIAFTPASADPGIAAMIAAKSGVDTQMVRFTPASATESTGERSVTVAVRVDRQTARALSTNAAAGTSAAVAAESPVPGLRIAPTRYNLGIARGLGSFASAPAAVSAPATSLSRSLSDANIPDLAEFRPRAGVREEESRFGARIALDQQRRTSERASPQRESVGDQLLDVGGSYRLTNNLDITAGVRYEQDRDLTPLPDVEQQDSQAVYVGTQFRF